jgi:hypothetical protein
VDAVPQVAGGVGDVDGGRVDEVFLGGSVLAGVGGGDRLDAFGQGRVAGGQRIVVAEYPGSFRRGEVVRE